MLRRKSLVAVAVAIATLRHCSTAVHLVAHLVVLIVVVVALVAIVVGRRKVLVLVVLIIVHLIVLGLLGRLLEINVLAACPTTAADDVLGRDGLEAALAVFLFVYMKGQLAIH